MLESDLEHVKAALGKLPRRRRPLLKLENHTDCRADTALAGDSQSDDEEWWSCGSACGSEVSEPGPQLQLVVERTFLSFPLPKQDVSEASAVAHSAPAGQGGN